MATALRINAATGEQETVTVPDPPRSCLQSFHAAGLALRCFPPVCWPVWTRPLPPCLLHSVKRRRSIGNMPLKFAALPADRGAWPALGLTDAQIDALFIAAAVIE